MPLQLVRQRLRLRADERSRLPLLDQYTHATPRGWTRAATQFEIALASGGSLVDVGNLSSVTLEASPSNDRKGPRAFSKTLAGSALDNALTEATWTDGTRQHAAFVFNGTEMNLPLDGATHADLWLVVSAVTNAGDPLVCGTGRLTMMEDGAFADAGTAPPNPAVFLTMDQADARYVRPAGALNLAPGITAVTGGGPTHLDGMATSALPNYYAVLVRETGLGLTAWVLETGRRHLIRRAQRRASRSRQRPQRADLAATAVRRCTRRAQKVGQACRAVHDRVKPGASPERRPSKTRDGLGELCLPNGRRTGEFL